MATILAVGNSEGERRCDGRCHNAHEPECDCICGGRYHGKGRQAQELMTDDAREGRFGEGLAELLKEHEQGVQLGLPLAEG